jgi:phosphohistidine phosphatase
MDLYLLRHGKAGVSRTYIRSMSPSGMHEKALTATGIAEVERSGKALRVLDVKPDAIITSPLKRAHQTAVIIDSILFGAEGSKTRNWKRKKQLKKFQVWNDLAPEGDRINVYKNLSKFKYGSKILVVGHEPFLTKMISEIVSSTSSSSSGYDVPKSTRRHSQSLSTPLLTNNTNYHSSLVLKKAGLAKVRISTMNPKLAGELRWLLTPMVLRKLSSTKVRKEGNKRQNQVTHYDRVKATPVVIPATKTKSTKTAISH